MYLSDFVQLDGERFYVSVDTRTATIGLTRVSHTAIETFIRNVLSISMDGSLPNGRLPKVSSEVSA